MSPKSVTLNEWLAAHPGALVATVLALAGATARIAQMASMGWLTRPEPAAMPGADGAAKQPSLAAAADRCIDEALGECEHVAGWASGEGGAPFVSDWHGESGHYLVVYDPFNGSRNAADLPAGTLFSILPHPFHGTTPGAAGFLQPGRKQVASGYVMYGAATIMALTCGDGVAMFTLDPRDGAWRLTRQQVTVPQGTSEYAIDAAQQRYWAKPIQRYVAECVAGVEGPRGRDFSLRWTQSLVVEAHRILTGGGVFLHPCDNRKPYRPGHQRLLFEAAPVALLMEQAGAGAVTGTQQLLEVVPDTLHQPVPVIFGSSDEVQLIVRYHADPSENVSWQLFKTRSLFVQPQA